MKAFEVFFENYTLLQKVYARTSTTIYRARRHEDGLSVLLKVHTSHPPSAEDLARFHHEYALSKQLSMSGVLQTQALEKQADFPILVLEDYAGIALDQRILANPLDLKTVLKLGIRLAGILDEVHRCNIIHCNIQPQNIWLARQSHELKVTNFSQAIQFAQVPQMPSFLGLQEGRLSYMSPEQTGRMNRVIDWRTDFYSLGVTLYELLVQRLPFEGEDAMELIHSHIAKTPPTPHELVPTVPQGISDIVMKLMAKTVEERYQSATGLQKDLEDCFQRWQQGGSIPSFALGQQDVSEKLRLPQKLYGRDTEMALLEKTFEDSSLGNTKILLISGRSGVGKSSLVQEIQKVVVAKQGYFVCGKCDLFQRQTPYASLLQAVQELLRFLLQESEQQLQEWKARLLAVLETNGRVLLRLLPELEWIIGPQPEITPLPSLESQNRFHQIFHQFIKLFAQPNHPLVVFLDDVQWMDLACLQLLEFLMDRSDDCALLLIGTYRTSETPINRSLQMLLERAQRNNHGGEILELDALSEAGLSQWIADTLQQSISQVAPLAQVVSEKTAGNPFFVQQFLKSIHEQNGLSFDSSSREWTWDSQQIQQMAITENVVDLLAHKIETYPPPLQQALKTAACLGNQFDSYTLSKLLNCSPEAVDQTLLTCLEEGLLQNIGHAPSLLSGAASAPLHYRFPHDRMRQVAYQLRPEPAAIHMRIARMLLQHMSAEEQSGHCFLIANQLNQGRALLKHNPEKGVLAQWNFDAGMKAKQATAYQQALDYFTIGEEAFSENPWPQHYDLHYALLLEAALCAHLTSHFELAESHFETLLTHAQSKLDKVKVFAIQVEMYATRGDHTRAIEVGAQSFQYLGLRPLFEINEDSILKEGEALKEKIKTLGTQNLLDLPMMTDPEKLLAVDMLTRLTPSAYVTNRNFLVLSMEAIRLSVDYGNSPLSATAYSGCGALLHAEMIQDFQMGYEFAKLGLTLSEKLDALYLKAKTYHTFSMLIPYTRHTRHSLPYSKQAFQYGFESGDWVYAGYATSTHAAYVFFLDRPLSEVNDEIQQALDFVQKNKNQDNIFFLYALRFAISQIQGNAGLKVEEQDENWSEVDLLQEVKASENVSNLGWCYVFQLGVFCLFEEYAGGLELVFEIQKVITPFAVGLNIPEYHFFAAQVWIGLIPEVNDVEKVQYLKNLQDHLEVLRHLSKACTENFMHKFLLIEAETFRLQGKTLEALKGYEHAIQHAQAQGYIKHVALAHETALRFHWDQQFKNYAKPHLDEALQAYRQWGAFSKVEQLEKKYAVLLDMPPPQVLPAPFHAESLDFNSVLKASQTLSEEIRLEHLLEKMLTLMMENAGARSGFLILKHDDEFWVEAIGTVDLEKAHVGQRMLLEQCDGLSPRIVQFVVRTKESLILSNASLQGDFQHDPYVLRTQPKSILCTPILHQNQVSGVLYLENAALSEAFTSQHLQVLHILSVQAAIALENALLYANSEKLVETRTQALQQEVQKKERAYDLLKSIFDGMAEGVVTLDRHFKVTTLSAKACKILGISEERALNKPAAAILGTPLAGPSGALLRLDQRSTETTTLQTELLSPSGAVIPINLSVSPLGKSTVGAQWLLLFSDRREEERQMRKNAHGVAFGKMVSNDPKMKELFQFIDNVATSNATVLIQGQSGTGKELVAQELHTRSRRAQKPFYAINCAAIPANLLESEFFGHEKGAFTGAQQRKLGHFELANQGTLFLDEVGEIPIELQGKLLRALQEQVIQRVGGSQTFQIDVRIVAATNRDLLQMVQEQQFREDLYYRLDVISLKLPPLRERLQDIPYLVQHFMEELNRKEQREVSGVHPEVLQHLLKHTWPGNIRELYNTLEYAFAVSQGNFLLPEHLPHKFQTLAPATESVHPPRTEKEAILRALEQSNFRKNKAAALLGISYVTLYRKLKKYGI